jgi:hypothetical protein
MDGTSGLASGGARIVPRPRGSVGAGPSAARGRGDAAAVAALLAPGPRLRRVLEAASFQDGDVWAVCYSADAGGSSHVYIFGGALNSRAAQSGQRTTVSTGSGSSASSTVRYARQPRSPAVCWRPHSAHVNPSPRSRSPLVRRAPRRRGWEAWSASLSRTCTTCSVWPAPSGIVSPGLHESTVVLNVGGSAGVPSSRSSLKCESYGPLSWTGRRGSAYRAETKDPGEELVLAAGSRAFRVDEKVDRVLEEDPR